MFKTIVVPVDGSELAERALIYAARITAPADGCVVLLQATPLYWQESQAESAEPATSPAPSPGASLAAANPGARMALEAAAARVQAKGVTAVVDFETYRQGDMATADVILAAVEEQQADLVVMATRGDAGIARWLRGSVSDRIARGADVPVMLVPAAVERPWPEDRALRILVPLDGSVVAEEVLDPAGRLAEQIGGELHLVRVVEPPPLSARADAAGDVPPASEAERDEARDYLASIRDRFQRAGVRASVRTVDGNPRAMIVDVAREADVDLIAMATHGRGGVGRVAMGSVADATLQRSAVPVLLVRLGASPAAASPGG